MKLVHLVGCSIRIFHDEQSPERETRDEHPCLKWDSNSAIPATKLVQTYTSDLMATELGTVCHNHDLYSVENKINMNIGIGVERPANKFQRRD